MVKVQKTISLDEYTGPLAEEKGNFSAWVRHALIEDDQKSRRRATEVGQEGELVHIAKRFNNNYQTDLCWPFHPNGVCTLCWPDGPPTNAHWRDWVRGEWDLREGARPPGVGFSEEMWAEKGESDPQSRGGTEIKTPQRQYVRRLLAWLWNWI